MSHRSKGNIWSFLHWFEKKVVRLMILGAAFLAISQLVLGLATDPVDFYLNVTKQVEAPLLEIENTETSQETFKITLAAVPAAPITILQNGKIIGNLVKGQEELIVKPGKIQLDGRNVAQIIRIKVINLEPNLVEPRLNQVYVLERNVKDITIRP